MSDTADAILEAGIRDAQTALLAASGFNESWQTFANACQTQQFDLATVYGERLVALVESAVDLYASANRRMSQFQKLTQEPQT